MNALQYFRDIVKLNRDTYWIVLIYGVSIALLSLVVPIAAQALVNVVSFGSLLQPVIVLTILVFIILSAVAGLRIAQAVLVETIQQRVFTQTAIDLSKHLPEIKLSNFDKYRVSELVNGFFEVQTIQKSLSLLLITGIEIILLSISSMLLIAFYHPLLLVFNFILIATLFLALWLPHRNAMKYAITECYAKHDVAAWLEEIVLNITLFKVQNHATYAMQVTDERLCSYLSARQNHFRYLLRHIIGMNMIYVIANSVLLGIGGYLVINEQLSLGQLVASELVVNALLYGFVRTSLYIEDLYDLLASSNKLGNLLTIPKEASRDEEAKHLLSVTAKLDQPLSISCQHLSFKTKTNDILFQDLSFRIAAGKHFVLIGDKGTGKSILVDFLLGFRQPETGIIRVNEIPVLEHDLKELRSHTALVRKIELFSGTVYQNLVLHRRDIPIETVHEVLSALQLNRTIEKLPQGLDTFISGSQMTMSTTELIKLMFARAILTQPSLMIIDGTLDSLPDRDVDLFLNYFGTLPATIIITTRKRQVSTFYDEYLTL